MKMKCPQCGVKGKVPDSLLGKKVRCPKCKFIFVATDDAPSTPKTETIPEPATSPVIETTGRVVDSEPAQGMTAQEEAKLEGEIAKIFADMKSAPESSPKPVQEAVNEDGDFLGQPLEENTPGQSAEAGLSVDDLRTELENIIKEECSVCGTFVGEATKHELNGVVYCSVCLPAAGGEEPASREIVVSGSEAATDTGLAKTISSLFAGTLVIAAIILAAYFFMTK